MKYIQPSANNTFGDILGAAGAAAFNGEGKGLGVNFRHEVPFESAASLAGALLAALILWSLFKKFALE